MYDDKALCLYFLSLCVSQNRLFFQLFLMTILDTEKLIEFTYKVAPLVPERVTQVSISSTFYKQLLCAEPESAKKTDSMTSGSARVKLLLER